MSWEVTKAIDFCYGHRLLDYEGKCRMLHGHNGLVEVSLTSPELDHRGMVYDFTDIKHLLKGWIDEHLDHKMILNSADPVIPALKELGEPLYIMDGNPTAENIAREIYTSAQTLGLPVARVKLWETPSSFAVYGPPGH